MGWHNMSLLTELGECFAFGSTNMTRLRRWEAQRTVPTGNDEENGRAFHFSLAIGCGGIQTGGDPKDASSVKNAMV